MNLDEAMVLQKLVGRAGLYELACANGFEALFHRLYMTHYQYDSNGNPIFDGDWQTALAKAFATAHYIHFNKPGVWRHEPGEEKMQEDREEINLLPASQAERCRGA